MILSPSSFRASLNSTAAHIVSLLSKKYMAAQDPSDGRFLIVLNGDSRLLKCIHCKSALDARETEAGSAGHDGAFFMIGSACSKAAKTSSDGITRIAELF